MKKIALIIVSRPILVWFAKIYRPQMHEVEINCKWIMNCLWRSDILILWSIGSAGKPQLTRSYFIFSEGTRGTILFGKKIWLMSLSLCGWWQSLVHVWLRLWHSVCVLRCPVTSRDIMSAPVSPAGEEIKWPGDKGKIPGLSLNVSKSNKDDWQFPSDNKVLHFPDY